MWGALFIILGLVLATLCIISVIRNLILSYKLVNGSLKNIAVITFIIASIICSLLIAVDGIELSMALNELKKGVNLPKEEIDLLQALIRIKIKSALLESAAGCGMYAIHLLIFKKLQKEIDKEIKKNSKNIWRF